MKTWICVDPGSTHDGDLDKANALVKDALTMGANAIKFQLLAEKQLTGGNILLPWEYMPELIALGAEKGIEVFASVFDFAGLSYLMSIGCKSVKFAYSQAELLRDSAASIPEDVKIYASYDVMSPHICERATTLYCIPEYPVRYPVNFDGLFPRFDGFSSHCLGIQQEIEAVKAGAKYLEFHIKGDWDSPTPDARFAKSYVEAMKLIDRIRIVERPYHVHDGIQDHGQTIPGLRSSDAGKPWGNPANG